LPIPSHLAAVEQENAQQLLPEPVIQLLASSVATVLKAAKVAGIDADFLLPHHFARVPGVWRSMTPGVGAASVSLLLLRIAGA